MDEIRLKTIRQIRMLCGEIIQKASSGHPGLPLGAAPMAFSLFNDLMKYDPSQPHWVDRDRFVLSAGHGSSLIYTMLYLYGYDVSLEDLKSFRQLGSKTPGHPEYWCLPGVETATGPLGAGFSNAVGMALAEKRLNAKFGSDVFNHRTWVLASDGDMEEGISNESAQFAGAMKLGKLCVLYDSNDISIEGDTRVTFNEDTAARFRAMGWYAEVIDGENPDNVTSAVEKAFSENPDVPKLIVCRTVIARDAIGKEGSASSHGSPLGEDVLSAMRKNYGYEGSFHLDKDVLEFTSLAGKRGQKNNSEWSEKFDIWKKQNPEEYRIFKKMQNREYDDISWPEWEVGSKEATRKSGGIVLNTLVDYYPALCGGSADLAPSNNTWIKKFEAMTADNPSGGNIHFGIREHAMGGIVNGMALHGFHHSFGATFLVFSDYMRGAIRLSAIMNLKVTWIFTHDSFYVGEDGPTHQPVEHIDALRLIPGLKVIRPADGNEIVAAWKFILDYQGPVCLILSRQNLEALKDSSREVDDLRGYSVKSVNEPAIQIFSSGSEVSLALQTADILEKDGLSTEVISVPMLDLDDTKAMEDLAGKCSGLKVAVETATTRLFAGFGIKHRIGMTTFGESGKASEIAQHFGFTPEKVAEKIKSLISLN
ncbi:MAG: transketolase [Deltaproteobacteria bacterium]|nr:transketolase [Deltaproteobacteria bacterium]